MKLAVAAGALAVGGRALCACLAGLGIQLPHDSSRDANRQAAGGDVGAWRDNGPSADHSLGADAGAVEHGGVHPHQGAVLDRAAMKDGGMADSDIGPDLGGEAGVGVDNGVILDVAAWADEDAVGIPTQHGAVPNARLGSDFDMTDDDGSGGEEGGWVDEFGVGADDVHGNEGR